jgi:hypothetical protein
MSDLLTDIRRDIRARLEELRPAVTEYARLEEARAALTGTASRARTQAPGRPNTYPRRGGNPGRASARRRNAPSVSSTSTPPAQGKSKQPSDGRGRRRTKRAARGANQAAVVAALRKRNALPHQTLLRAAACARTLTRRSFFCARIPSI